jgi:hypothetical protein
MLRSLALAVLLAVGLASCGGEPAPAPPSSATARATAPVTSVTQPTSPPPSGPVSPSPTVDADVHVPARAPTTLADDVPADELSPAELAPRGARIASAWTTPADAGAEAVAFAWTRGGDPFTAETGFEVWTRFAGSEPAWRAVYAFTDEADSGVLGVRFETGDLTGDGVPDALTFEDIGGSGACGTWRVVRIGTADATEIYSKQTCDTDVRISGGDLRIRAAVYEPGDAHCCPSAYRTTTLRYTGTRWEVVDRTTEPA